MLGQKQQQKIHITLKSNISPSPPSNPYGVVPQFPPASLATCPMSFSRLLVWSRVHTVPLSPQEKTQSFCYPSSVCMSVPWSFLKSPRPCSSHNSLLSHLFIFFNCHLLHRPSTERNDLSYPTEVTPDIGTDMPCIARLKEKQQVSN